MSVNKFICAESDMQNEDRKLDTNASPSTVSYGNSWSADAEAKRGALGFLEKIRFSATKKIESFPEHSDSFSFHIFSR